MQAAGSNKPEIVKLLLDKGADVNARAGKGFVGVAGGVLLRQPADCESAAGQRNADVKAADSVGHTPLIGAAFKGNVDIARRLLDKGAEKEAAPKVA
jgi:ankyrin repeat protein